ncbi:Uu.00g014020.m01.CDS01 [Anthostomella pinea]|uniref:Uu.00g014020.m01.CDS01 n=1 Tax=Anthostomella pinea TaxID=933095 RepID=A0AAI8VY85_9PEZI|nr:Uu.00g014020.m01.CDS01 [Anthostomella pinea]
MDQEGQRPRTTVVTVETNNFNAILEHFDEDGHLLNPPPVHLSIECQICYDKNLALVNPRFDTNSRDTHEVYAVLPRCGHAFGYSCLFHWFNMNRNGRNPGCPSCRAPVFCAANHATMLTIYGAANPQDQAREIVDIGNTLQDPSCATCHASHVSPPPSRSPSPPGPPSPTTRPTRRRPRTHRVSPPPMPDGGVYMGHTNGGVPQYYYPGAAPLGVMHGPGAFQYPGYTWGYTGVYAGMYTSPPMDHFSMQMQQARFYRGF